MSRNKRFCAVILLLPALLCLFSMRKPISAHAVTAKGECVAEVSSRRFLHEMNADIRLPMASTTKILTALLILCDCDLEEEVIVPKEAEGTEGSSVYLKAGDRYSVRDLLYGLMLRSGNDCAVTLALYHSGSIARFARAMNEKAVSLGAENSHFTNPHGLPDDEHYTTARDLALITCAAMENDTFREIVSCKYYAPRGWKNKNKLLTEYEGANGVKTGYTLRAGRCLVSCAEREGMNVVCVLLGCSETYERTAELLDEAFCAYSLYTLCSAGETIEGCEMKYTFRYPLKKTELRALRFDCTFSDPRPTVHGEVAGQMRILLENNLLFSQNLYIM